jgi:hypothetical protein
MHPVIEVSGVRKTYGKTVAVEEASFEVIQGRSGFCFDVLLRDPCSTPQRTSTVRPAFHGCVGLYGRVR